MHYVSECSIHHKAQKQCGSWGMRHKAQNHYGCRWTWYNAAGARGTKLRTTTAVRTRGTRLKTLRLWGHAAYDSKPIRLPGYTVVSLRTLRLSGHVARGSEPLRSSGQKAYGWARSYKRFGFEGTAQSDHLGGQKRTMSMIWSDPAVNKIRNRPGGIPWWRRWWSFRLRTPVTAQLRVRTAARLISFSCNWNWLIIIRSIARACARRRVS